MKTKFAPGQIPRPLPDDASAVDSILGRRKKQADPHARFADWPLWGQYRRWYDYLKHVKDPAE